jgi:hypothetical protein
MPCIKCDAVYHCYNRATRPPLLPLSLTWVWQKHAPSAAHVLPTVRTVLPMPCAMRHVPCNMDNIIMSICHVMCAVRLLTARVDTCVCLAVYQHYAKATCPPRVIPMPCAMRHVPCDVDNVSCDVCRVTRAHAMYRMHVMHSCPVTLEPPAHPFPPLPHMYVANACATCRMPHQSHACMGLACGV